jgi:hypothetical protein
LRTAPLDRRLLIVRRRALGIGRRALLVGATRLFLGLALAQALFESSVLCLAFATSHTL